MSVIWITIGFKFRYIKRILIKNPQILRIKRDQQLCNILDEQYIVVADLFFRSITKRIATI